MHCLPRLNVSRSRGGGMTEIRGPLPGGPCNGARHDPYASGRPPLRSIQQDNAEDALTDHVGVIDPFK